jgi:hypothetical protein
MDSTPIYALEAEPPVGMDWNEPIDTAVDDEHLSDDLRRLLENLAHPPVSVVHRNLRDAITGQVLKDEDPEYVSRVSIPGVLTDRTTRLYSGQVVPVVEVKSRGVHAWNEARLVNGIIQAVHQFAHEEHSTALPDAELRKVIRAFLDKIYYQFRNLGQSSADRALNYAGTNGFLFGNKISEGLLSGRLVPGAPPKEKKLALYALDSITVSKSPYCRPGSDCQDVTVTFFDPENDQRAKTSYLFTFDVSDELPVSLAPVHTFLDR